MTKTAGQKKLTTKPIKFLLFLLSRNICVCVCVCSYILRKKTEAFFMYFEGHLKFFTVFPDFKNFTPLLPDFLHNPIWKTLAYV